MIYEIDDQDMDVSPFDLAILFAFRGWDYAAPEYGFGLPTPEQIRSMLRSIVNKVMEDGRPSASERLGRFLAVRHDNGPDATELSNSVNLYLDIGYLWALLEDDE